MLDLIEKVVALLGKVGTFVFQYFGDKPKITLALEEKSSGQGASSIPGTLSLMWSWQLVLHNDSAHLIRGIKLLRPFPKGWTLKGEVPTRLEADEKVRIPVDASTMQNQRDLVAQYGEGTQTNFARAFFPKFASDVSLEFELVNQRGRKTFQYSAIQPDGTVRSELSSKRRANGG